MLRVIRIRRRRFVHIPPQELAQDLGVGSHDHHRRYGVFPRHGCHANVCAAVLGFHGGILSLSTTAFCDY